jgi:hypothetical protein
MEVGKVLNGRCKLLTTIAVLVLSVGIFCSPAIAWNWGVHAYVDDHIGKRQSVSNLNEMYGSFAPDIFIYYFDHPEYGQVLTDWTHHDFDKVWRAAKSSNSKAEAFGFVSHNDTWGADYTAHHSSRTLVDRDKGYVIAKAEILAVGVSEQLASIFPNTDTAILEAIALTVSHDLLEYGVDIILTRKDHLIGEKIMTAAIVRSPDFPYTLAKAYAPSFAKYSNMSLTDATRFIVNSERDWRKFMIFYGFALTQDEDVAIQLLSEHEATIAQAFLGAYGIEVADSSELIPLISEIIMASIDLCKDDALDEINATVSYVNKQMLLHRITY